MVLMTKHSPVASLPKPHRASTRAITLVAAAVAVCVVFSARVSGRELTLIKPAPSGTRSPFGYEMSELLRQFGIRLIPRARAAECTEEGEICTSTEQCCAGLECLGGPPASCATSD